MTDWNEHEDAISDAISDSIDMDWTSRTGAKAVISWLNENAAAPAPSSLAGGEVMNDDALEVRMAMQDEMMASDANGGRVSQRIARANRAADTILAALSPEAPAREGATHPDAQPFERFPELALHIERMAMTGLVGSMISWDAFLRELNAALTPRHEAPAEGEAVAWMFELATCRDPETGTYSSWNPPQLSFIKPCVPAGSIRNLASLGLITHPATPIADKLRIAVEAIWEIAGGRAAEGHNETGRLARIKDRASEALDALKAEGV